MGFGVDVYPMFSLGRQTLFSMQLKLVCCYNITKIILFCSCGKYLFIVVVAERKQMALERKQGAQKKRSGKGGMGPANARRRLALGIGRLGMHVSTTSSSLQAANVAAQTAMANAPELMELLQRQTSFGGMGDFALKGTHGSLISVPSTTMSKFVVSASEGGGRTNPTYSTLTLPVVRSGDSELKQQILLRAGAGSTTSITVPASIASHLFGGGSPLVHITGGTETLSNTPHIQQLLTTPLTTSAAFHMASTAVPSSTSSPLAGDGSSGGGNRPSDAEVQKTLASEVASTQSKKASGICYITSTTSSGSPSVLTYSPLMVRDSAAVAGSASLVLAAVSSASEAKGHSSIPVTVPLVPVSGVACRLLSPGSLRPRLQLPSASAAVLKRETAAVSLPSTVSARAAVLQASSVSTPSATPSQQKEKTVLENRLAIPSDLSTLEASGSKMVTSNTNPPDVASPDTASADSSVAESCQNSSSVETLEAGATSTSVGGPKSASVSYTTVSKPPVASITATRTRRIRMPKQYDL